MGPTASGKSALALALAERFGGEIVNADSMQVYRELRVLTARPSAEEAVRAPHHLYGHVAADEAYSVGRWLSDALPIVGAIRERGGLPIVAGGTGLYFRALTQGLAEMPEADVEVRARLRARCEAEGAPALHADLAKVDAESAERLSLNDAPRILRALEIWETSGETIGALRAATAPALAKSEWRALALTPDRAQLYETIERRFDAMLAAGALDEVKRFCANPRDPALPVMKAHGLPALSAHLRGEMTLEDAADIAKRDTRNYAKRQFTWIRNQMRDWATCAEPAIEARLEAAAGLLGEDA